MTQKVPYHVNVLPLWALLLGVLVSFASAEVFAKKNAPSEPAVFEDTTSENNATHEHADAGVLANESVAAKYPNAQSTNTQSANLTNNPKNTKTAQHADTTEVQQALARALNDDAYGKRETRTEWRVKDKPNPKITNKKNSSNWNLTGFGDGIAALFEWVFWVALAVLVIYLLSRYGEWSKWLGGFGRLGAQTKAAKPTELFGLEVTQESLPNDVAAQFQRLISQGDHRSAVALIYRASLVYLIYEHGLHIGRAATEGECVQLVGKVRPKQELAALTAITKLWLPVAYAQKKPTQEELHTAFAHYQKHFDAGRIGSHNQNRNPNISQTPNDAFSGDDSSSKHA